MEQQPISSVFLAFHGFVGPIEVSMCIHMISYGALTYIDPHQRILTPVTPAGWTVLGRGSKMEQQPILGWRAQLKHPCVYAWSHTVHTRPPSTCLYVVCHKLLAERGLKAQQVSCKPQQAKKQMAATMSVQSSPSSSPSSSPPPPSPHEPSPSPNPKINREGTSNLTPPIDPTTTSSQAGERSDNLDVVQRLLAQEGDVEVNAVPPTDV